MKSLIIVPFLIGSLPILGSVAIGYNYLKSKKDSKYLYWGGITTFAFGGWMASNMIMSRYLDNVPISVLKAESFNAETSDYEKLEYIHSTLQECLQECSGDDIMVETSLEFVEDLREPYFDAESYSAESDNFIWCAYCDDLITDEYYFTDGKKVHVDCNLEDSWDAETFEAKKHSGRRSKRKKQGLGTLAPSRRNKQTNEWRPFNNRIKSRKEQQQDLEDYERHGGAENFSAESFICKSSRCKSPINPDNSEDAYGEDGYCIDCIEESYFAYGRMLGRNAAETFDAGYCCADECCGCGNYECCPQNLETREEGYGAESFSAKDDFMGFEYYYLVDADGNKGDNFTSLEEAQIARSYVPNKNLKIMRRRFEGRNMVGKTTEVTEFDPYKNPNYFKTHYHGESFSAENKKPFIVYGEYKNGQRIKLGESATARGAKRIVKNKENAGILNFDKYESYGYENANDYYFNEGAYDAESHAYSYAYNEGHSDSRKREEYRPNLSGARQESDFKRILKQKGAESFAASGSGDFTYEGGRMVSIEEVTIVDYNWHTDPDETDDIDSEDIESQVQEKVENEMYDGDSGNDSWSYGTDSDGTNVEVYYEWNKTVEDGGEEYIKGW